MLPKDYPQKSNYLIHRHYTTIKKTSIKQYTQYIIYERESYDTINAGLRPTCRPKKNKTINANKKTIKQFSISFI